MAQAFSFSTFVAGATWASGPLAGANTSSVALPSGLAGTWAHGAVVRAVVNATSLAGVRSSLASTLTVDLTPPVKGQVELYMPHPLVAFGQLATGDACISLEQGRVTLRWTSVVDFESGIASCVLAPIWNSLYYVSSLRAHASSLPWRALL